MVTLVTLSGSQKCYGIIIVLVPSKLCDILLSDFIQCCASKFFFVSSIYI